MLRAFVTKIGGHLNHEYSTKVINFYQMLDVTSPKCLEIILGNLLGISRRHLWQLNAKETTDVLIKYDHGVIAERCVKYVEKAINR